MDSNLKTIDEADIEAKRRLFEQPDLPLSVMAQQEDLAEIVASELQYLEAQGYWNNVIGSNKL